MDHKRSRRGCSGCHAQHRKCDETQPRCARCIRRNIECNYQRQLRWANASVLPRKRLSTTRGIPGPQLKPRSPILAIDRRIEESRDEEESSDHVVHEAHALDTTDCQTGPNSLPRLDIVQHPLNQLTPNDNGLSLTAPLENSALWTINDHAIRGLFTFPTWSIGDEATYIYFIRVVTLILPAYDGIQNGYRQLAVLALSSPVLMDTILSTATIYMHLRGRAPMPLTVERQARALATIRNSLPCVSGVAVRGAEGDATSLRRNLLATILLQITFEIHSAGSGIQHHINGALHLFRDLGYESSQPQTPVGTLIVQRMTFVDVVSSIYWHRRPFLPLDFWYYHSNDLARGCRPTLEETTGCPHWLIRYLARISYSAADMDDRNSVTLDMPQAYALEVDLTATARQHLNNRIENGPQDDHLHILGQCYYWTAVLLLQLRVFHDACTSLRVQSVLLILVELMESLPLGCGPDSSLSMPLYVAACAANDLALRRRIRHKSCELTKEYPSKTREAMTAAFDALWNSEFEVDLVKTKFLFIC